MIELALRSEDQGEIVEILGVVGGEGDGPADQLDGLRVVAQLMGDQAEHLEGIGVARILRAAPGGERFGIGKAASLIMLNGQLVRLRNRHQRDCKAISRRLRTRSDKESGQGGPGGACGGGPPADEARRSEPSAGLAVRARPGGAETSDPGEAVRRIPANRLSRVRERRPEIIFTAFGMSGRAADLVHHWHRQRRRSDTIKNTPMSRKRAIKKSGRDRRHPSDG